MPRDPPKKGDLGLNARMYGVYRGFPELPDDWHPLPSFLGRLGIKVEAAGKIRVFAMVDPWTQ